MKIAWLLLISLVLVFVLMDESEAWRRRRLRIRIRVRRVVPRLRRVIRIRGRRFFRKVGSYLKGAAKAIITAKIMTNPWLYVMKKTYDRYKQKKQQAIQEGHAEICSSTEICGGSCDENAFGKIVCKYFCDDMCSVFANDKFKWPGEAIALPCKFGEYDLDGNGYLDLFEFASIITIRESDISNNMLFYKLDQDHNGKVTSQEFENTKSILLIDQDDCTT